MKIKELLYKTPEMSEEKLIENINKNISIISSELKRRIQQLYKEPNLAKSLLDEYDLIQDKKSYLTKRQRDQVVGFIGLCMIQITKDNG